MEITNERNKRVIGHLTVTKRYDDHDEIVFDDPNTVVDTGFEAFALLISQLPGPAAGDAANEVAIHSMWFESAATAFTQGVTSADTGPDPAATVAKRHVFDRLSDVSPNLGGTLGLTQFTGTVGKLEAVGETIRAAGLYTRGTDDDPLLASNIRLVARQIIGAIDKTNEFAVIVNWRIQFLTV